MSNNWFNENSFRSYPFISNFLIPTDVIVDAGIVLGLTSDFDPTVDTVTLDQLRHEGGALIFTFRTSASFAAAQPLVFTIPDSDPPYKTYFADASPTPADSLACPPFSLWEGFITLGPRETLLSLFIGNLFLLATPIPLEPGLIQDTSNRGVRSINLGNFDRSRVSPPDGCSDDGTAGDTVYPSGGCLDGDVAFVEGYNASIRQDDSTNSITIGAAVGAGAGQACEEVPLHSDEAPPSNSKLLSGGPACDEILQTINGISAVNFQLFPGTGFQITAKPGDPHGLRISANLTDFALCGQDGSLTAPSS